MANVSTVYSGILTPDATENVDIPADLLQMANSFDAKMIGFFPDLASRDAAAASFIAAGKKLCAYVYTSGFFVYNGSAWENIGNIGPVQYSTSTGSSGTWSQGLTPVSWNTAFYTFTPSRTGWAEIGYDCDVSKVTAGFGYAAFQAQVTTNGGLSYTTLSNNAVLFDTDTRNLILGYRTWGNFKLNQGVSTSLALLVYNFSIGGTWAINSFTWHVVQQ